MFTIGFTVVPQLSGIAPSSINISVDNYTRVILHRWIVWSKRFLNDLPM